MPIDPEARGAKIVAQMKKIGWPLVFTADKLNDEALLKALDYCLTNEARIKAQSCRIHAMGVLEETRKDFIGQLNGKGLLEENFLVRTGNSKANSWAEEMLKQASASQRIMGPGKIKLFAKKIAFLLLPLFFSVRKRLQALKNRRSS